MAGEAMSGKDGDLYISLDNGVTYAKKVGDMTQWDFSPKANVPTYVSNDTEGFTETVEGNRSGQISITGKWRPQSPVTDYLQEGMLVLARLFISKRDPSTDLQGNPIPGLNQFWDVKFRISDGPKLTVNRESGDILTWTCSGPTHGKWIKPVASTNN